MPEASRYEHIVLDRYRFRGYRGCESCCGLEILRSPAGATVVIVTELEDNPGTSVTNAFEHLAYWVCIEFGIDLSSLVWIEHYGYPSPIDSKSPRTYDLVTFDILPPGNDAVFARPQWRPMNDVDWQKLGLPVRR